MRPRRIALLITTITLIVLTVPAASAHSQAPTLSHLRAQLRKVRTQRHHAQATLSKARTDLDGVRALVAAAGGLPAFVTAQAAADPAPAPFPDATASPEATPSPDATPQPTPAPTTVAAGDAAAGDVSGYVSGGADLPTLIAALRPSLATRLLADGAVTADEVSALERRVVRWRRFVRRLRRAERSLARRIAIRSRIAAWNRKGAWRPLIEIAARRRGISANGLYRLMMAESGGRRYAGTTYKGLFQYYPGTWRASWNPWGDESIYNGWAQIQATAYAIDRGMGPSNWPATYPAAF